MVEELATHGYAAALLQTYRDKLVEINTGESATTLLFDDHQVTQKSVIRGVIKDALGDALIIECNVNGAKQKVLINSWSINMVMELKGNGNLRDIYVDEDTERRRKRQTNR